MPRLRSTILVAVCILVMGLLATGAQPLDDALITLRYARSVAAGAGFVFNLGEHVLGTTTPLFTLLLAALQRVTGADLLGLAYGTACVAHLGSVVVLALAGARCGFPLAGVAAAALSGLAPIVLSSVVGCMETSCFIFVVLVGLSPLLPLASRWRATAVAAALLTRPEGALVVLLYLGELLALERRVVARRAGLVVLLVLPWVTFATLYFGSPLAQSVHAKWETRFFRPPLLAAEQFWYLLVSLPTAAPRIQIQSLVPVPFGTLIASAVPLGVDLMTRRVLVLLLGAGVLVVSGVGAIGLWRRCAEARPMVLFVIAYIAAFCLARPPMFSWYLAPPQPILMLAFVAGAAILLAAVAGRFAPWLGAALVVLMVGLSVWQSRRFLEAYPATIRVRGYRAAVESLGSAGRDPQTRIGAFEVGAVGYYSRATILDHDGLVSPELLGLDVVQVFERFHPDFYIAYEGAMAKLLQAPAFSREYDLLASFPEYSYQGADLVVYRRRNSP
ncbi:MAG: hypothetical protein HY270_23680 [Deltaproteobacteria bacterium]|nr:hypothetical protein [Deltaproteobacteria bacterium]